MNKIFLKELKNNLKEVMKENHFKVNGQSYVRIINKQILQSIRFEAISGGGQFCVKIGIIPICSSKLSHVPSSNIGMKELCCNGGIEYWEYTEESIKEISYIIKDKVLPLLEKFSDYEKIYEELKTEVNDIPIKKKNGSDIKTILYTFIGEEYLFWVILRNKDYDKCNILLKNLKEKNLRWLNANLKSSEENIKNTQSQKYKKIFEDNKKCFIELAQKKSDRIENLEELLKNNEIEKLMSITKELEEKNLITFKKYIF